MKGEWKSREKDKKKEGKGGRSTFPPKDNIVRFPDMFFPQHPLIMKKSCKIFQSPPGASVALTGV